MNSNTEAVVASFVITSGTVTRYFEDSSVRVMHREDGPAYDSPSVKAWIVHGHFHREDGPAIERYNEFGVLYKEEYYLSGNDRRLKKEEWEVEMQSRVTSSSPPLSYEL